ncbi:hypothetical protein ACPZ19_22405 [Amycolatopsis lurida]
MSGRPAGQDLLAVAAIDFAWNFTESGVFGTAVSGAESEPGLLRTVLSGPDVLTGGTFGPEASLFALLCCFRAARGRDDVEKRRSAPGVGRPSGDGGDGQGCT